MSKISEALDKLRSTLNTPSLRRWLREEFLTRTKVLFVTGIPYTIQYVYTSPAQYTVLLHDPITGEVEEVKMTEAEIRAEFGDQVFEEAYAQLSDGDANVDLSDYERPFHQILAEVEEELTWGEWTDWVEIDDEPN